MNRPYVNISVAFSINKANATESNGALDSGT